MRLVDKVSLVSVSEKIFVDISSAWIDRLRYLNVATGSQLIERIYCAVE